MTLDPSRAAENPYNSDDFADQGLPLPQAANDPDAIKSAKRLTAVPADEHADGKYDHIRILSQDPLTLDGEPLITEVIQTPRKGIISRLYNSVASRIPPKEVLFSRERLEDMAVGMALSGAARYAIIGAGTAVGLTGVPIVLGSAVAASVARTAWNIQKERRAYMAETGENISFWSWATKQEKDEQGNFTANNMKKYRNMLATSTIFAGAGAAVMTYVMPNVEEWAAPVVERIKESQAFTAVSGFFAGIFAKISPPAVVVKPEPKMDPAAVARAREMFDKLLPPKTPPAQSVMSPEAIQRRIEEAHTVVTPAKPSVMPPEVIQKRIEEAHAAIVPEKTGTMSPEALKRLAEQTHAPVPMPKPELIDLPAPVITTADRITQLTQDHHFGKRWQGIIDHAMKGDAQAQKDIAKAVLNGTNGFDKNPEQAAELYRAAAAAGNTQAKVDLAYMQFHGLGGIQPDTKAALETLREQASGNKYARSMLRHLSGGETVHKSASAALKHAATAEAAPVQAVAAKAVTPTGNVPDGATLKVTWRQTADGAIEGVVNKTDVPGWLKDGMQVSFPTAEVK